MADLKKQDDMEELSCEDIARRAYGGVLPSHQRTEITLACGVKRCCRCRQWLTLDKFGMSVARNDGLNNKCLRCQAEYSQEWHARPANKGKCAQYTRDSRAVNPERTRNNRLADRCRAYGITTDRYHDMLATQQGGCAMCRKTPEQNRGMLCIDHDHQCCPTQLRSCGKCVRGLLCDACNKALGYVEAYSERAAQYLERKGKNPVGRG